jgi:hypothetical protein
MGTRNPVEVLKRGLKVLEAWIKAKHHDLMSKVAAKTRISDQEEEWLDKGGRNMVDEVQVIDKLETASDYERGLGRLDKKSKAVVQRLQELACDVVKVAGAKQKHESNNFKSKCNLTSFRSGKQIKKYIGDESDR